MAGHYRVAVAGVSLGAPEVNLGIIPGAEGTQRLPRLVGVAAAVEMCVSGKPVKAPEALRLGLIDQVIEGDLTVSGAVMFARDVAGEPGKKTRERNDARIGGGKCPDFRGGRAQAGTDPAQSTAPPRRAGSAGSRDHACRSSKAVRKSARSPRNLAWDQAKAMITVPFLRRARRGARFPESRRNSDIPHRRVGIIGAGTMGGGIAMACANAGIAVRIKIPISRARSRHGRDSEELRKLRQKGPFPAGRDGSENGADSPAADLRRIRPADLIIEAVFESMPLKRQIFAEIDKIAKPDCVLASNTSTLDIDEIAAATTAPDGRRPALFQSRACDATARNRARKRRRP